MNPRQPGNSDERKTALYAPLSAHAPADPTLSAAIPDRLKADLKFLGNLPEIRDAEALFGLPGHLETVELRLLASRCVDFFRFSDHLKNEKIDQLSRKLNILEEESVFHKDGLKHKNGQLETYKKEFKVLEDKLKASEIAANQLKAGFEEQMKALQARVEGRRPADPQTPLKERDAAPADATAKKLQLALDEQTKDAETSRKEAEALKKRLKDELDSKEDHLISIRDLTIEVSKNAKTISDLEKKVAGFLEHKKAAEAGLRKVKHVLADLRQKQGLLVQVAKGKVLRDVIDLSKKFYTTNVKKARDRERTAVTALWESKHQELRLASDKKAADLEKRLKDSTLTTQRLEEEEKRTRKDLDGAGEQLRKVKDTLVARENELRDTQDALNRLKKTAAEKEAELKKALADGAKRDLAIADLSKRHEELEAKHRNLEGQMAQAHGHIEAAKRGRAEVESILAQTKKTVADLENSLKAANEKLREREDALRTATGKFSDSLREAENRATKTATELVATQRQLKETQGGFEESRRKVAGLENQAKSSAQTIEALQAEIQKLIVQINDARSQAEKANAELASKSKEAKEASSRAAKRETETQEQLAAAAAERDSHEKTVKALMAEVAKQKEKGDALKASAELAEALKKELEVAQKDSKAKADQIQKLVTEVAAIKKEMAARTDETKKLAEQLKTANQEQAKATAKHTQELEAHKLHLQELLQHKTAEAAEAHKALKSLHAEEAKRTKDLEKEAKRLAEVSKEVEALKAVVHGRESQVASLEEEVKARDGRVSQLQKAFVEAQGRWDEDRKRLVHEVEALNKQLKEKGKPDNQLKALEEQNKDMEGLIQALEDDCSQKAAEIQERNARIWKLEVAVKEAETQVVELEGRLEAQLVEQATRKSPSRERVAEKELATSAKKPRRKQSSEQEVEIIGEAQEPDQRDQEIARLSAQLQAAKGELAAVQKALEESNVRSLKIEAGAYDYKRTQAAKVKKLEAELKETLSRQKVSERNFKKLEKKGVAATDRTAELEAHFEEVVGAHEELQAALETVTVERDDLAIKLAAEKKQTGVLRADLKRTEDKLKKASKAEVETARSKKKAEAQRSAEAEKQAKAAKLMANLKEAVETHDEQVDALNEEIEELQTQLEKAQKSIQKQLQKAKEEITLERARAEKATKKLAEIRKERVKEADDTAKWRQEAGKLRAEIGQWEADFLEREASEHKVAKQNKALAKELAELRLTIKQQDKKLQREKERATDEADKKLAEGKKQEARLAAEVAQLTEALKAAEGNSTQVEKLQKKLKTLKATAQKDREVRIRLEKKVRELHKRTKAFDQAQDDLKRIRGERDQANELAGTTKELLEFLVTLLEELGRDNSQKDWAKLTDPKPLKGVQANNDLAKLGKKAVGSLSTLREKFTNTRAPERQDSAPIRGRRGAQIDRDASQKNQKPLLGKRDVRQFHEVEALEKQVRELKATNSELRQKMRTWKSFENNYFNMYCCEGVRLCARKAKRTEDSR